MKYLNALNTIVGLGHKKMKILANHFETGEKIWHASLSELAKTGIGDELAQKIVEARPLIDVENEWQKLATENILVVSLNDPRYPTLLKQIPDCPFLIYMKGNLNCLDLPLIAIVGSRKLTNYGTKAAFGFSRDLARAGICVVSGLAFGVDACAHRGALEVKGKTIAVLGNSLDGASIAPRTNFELSEEILANGGLIVSEFPPQTSATVWTFPARNRIMAGMSQGTLVIEAAEKSGSLITANLALDYNREVFAVPGDIFSPQSVGTNLLIKAGAKVACGAQDVLEELQLEEQTCLHAKNAENKKQPVFDFTEQEEMVYNILSHESLHIDRISKMTKLDGSMISSILVMLEIKGAVKNIGGQNYVRN